MHDELQVSEFKPDTGVKINVRGLLTSTDVMAHNRIALITDNKPKMGRPPEGGRKKQPVSYPLRFRSKAQKKRLEDAAKAHHKTLRDFLLDLGEQVAAELNRQQVA